MSNTAPSNKTSEPSARSIDLSAEIIKVWGPQWNKPSISYEFSSGRKFELLTQDAAIYVTSPNF